MKKTDREKMNQDLFIAHLRSYLSCQFVELRDHFETVQRLFKDEESKFSHWFDSKTAGLSPEEKEQFGEWHSEDHWKFKDSFPTIQRNSVFITAYSELEEVLKFICSALASRKGCSIQAYKWRGGILEKVKSCLEQEIGITLSCSISLWDKIIKFRKIRNAIVHNSGWLDDREQTDREIIDHFNTENKSITLVEKNDGDGFFKIHLTDSFVTEVLDTFELLLGELLTPNHACPVNC